MTFRLRLADGADLSKTLRMGEELAYNMAAHSVRVARSYGYVDVEVGLPAMFTRALHVSALPQKGGSWVCLGKTPSGTPVHVNLAGTRACHALVSGMTGSGKTVAEHLVAWTLAHNAERNPESMRLILIDAKGGVHWQGFDREIHLAHPVISSAPEAVAALTWALAELDRRKATGQAEPTIFVIVDEIKELLDIAGKAVTEALARIAALGRELGIHLIVSTQYPSADSVGGSLTKANLPLRLTGAVVSSKDAYLCTGIKDSGAERLQGRGDFLITAGSDVYRLQMAHVRQVDMHKLPRAETTPHLDLGMDLDRVLDVSPALPEIEPDHLAQALISNKGINWIKHEIGLGQPRATQLRSFAVKVLAALDERGYSILPYRIHQVSTEAPVVA